MANDPPAKQQNRVPPAWLSVSRWRDCVIWTYDLAQHCVRELLHDRALEMAAALTYRTIFSLVPILMLVLVVFNAFGGFDKARATIQEEVYQHLGIKSLELPPTSGYDRSGSGDGVDMADPARTSEDGSTTSQPAAAPGEIRSRLDQVFTMLTEQASKITFARVGIIGLGLLIWAALAMVITVERCFNRIYDAPTGRPWHLRITIYWAVITLGPVMVVLSAYLTGWVVDVAARVPGVGPVLGNLTGMTAVLASWLLLFLLYVLMPNTKVNKRAALIAGFFTAIMYELGKWGFQLYVTKAVPYAKLYGSLGLVPLFLFWIYITWFIVLFGLELTYTLQAAKGHQFKHLRSSGDVRAAANPQWLIPVLATIGAAFKNGTAVTMGDMSEQLRLPQAIVNDLLASLEREGLVHRVRARGESDGGWTLSRPAEDIKMSRVIELAGTLTLAPAEKRDHPGWSCLDRLCRAQATAAGSATLATLLAKQGA